MPPRKKGPTKEAEASGAAAARKAVYEAYNAYRNKPSNEWLEALVALLADGRHGPAACMAVCKACMLDAAELAGSRAEEAQVVAQLTRASEAAVHGVLRYKSAQLLYAARLLLHCTHCSPHRRDQRQAIFRLLEHGPSMPQYGLDGRGTDEIDRRLLPVEALRANPSAARKPGFEALDSREHWWQRLRPDEWLPAEQEAVGTDKWPWECKKAGGQQEWWLYVGQVAADADLDIPALSRSDMLSGITAQVVSLKAQPGGREHAELDKLRQGLAQHRPSESPAERLAHSEALPAPRRAQLRQHLGLRAELERELERDREAVRGKPASRADEQRERRREQVALNEQAKQEEAAQQRLQAAVQHAFTVRSYLRLRLGEAASVEVLAELLQREARLSLAVVHQELERLGAEKAVPEQELTILRAQLDIALREAERRGTAGASLLFLLPAATQGDPPHAYTTSEEYHSALHQRLAGWLDEWVSHQRNKLADGVLQRVSRCAADLRREANRAVRQMPASLSGSPSEAECELEGDIITAPPELPQGEAGVSLRHLPYMCSVEMPHPAELPDVPDPTLEDMQELCGLPADPPPEHPQRGSVAAAAAAPPASPRSPSPAHSEASTETCVASGSGLRGAPSDDSDLEGSGGFMSAQPSAASPGMWDDDMFVDTSPYPSPPESPAVDQRRQPEAASQQPRAASPAVGLLQAVLDDQLAARKTLQGMFNCSSWMDAEERWDAAPQFDGLAMLQLAYCNADRCVRPGVKGCLLLYMHTSIDRGDQLDSRLFQSLESVWCSGTPLPAVLAQLGIEEDRTDAALRALAGTVMRQPELQQGEAALESMRARLQLDSVVEMLRCVLCRGSQAQLKDLLAGCEDEVKRAVVAVRKDTDRLTQLLWHAVVEFIDSSTGGRAWERGCKLQAEARAEGLRVKEASSAVMALPQIAEFHRLQDEARALGIDTLDARAADQMFCDAVSDTEAGHILLAARKRKKALLNEVAAEQETEFGRALVSLPLRALEQLHAFACLQAAHSYSSPLEFPGDAAERRVLQMAAGELQPAEVEAGEEGQGGEGGGGGSDDAGAALLKWTLALSARGIASAFGPGAQGLPVDQLLQNISLFASGLEPTASGGAADTGAVAPPPPAATQAGQPTGKAGKRLGGRGGEAGAADGAAVALSVHGSGAAGQLAFARREEQEGGMGRAYAVVWSSRSFLALASAAHELVHMLTCLGKYVGLCSEQLKSEAEELLSVVRDCEFGDVDAADAYELAEAAVQLAGVQLSLIRQLARGADLAVAFQHGVVGEAADQRKQAVETCLQAVRAGHASPAPYLPPTGQELEKVLKEENRAASAALHAARDAAFKAEEGTRSWMHSHSRLLDSYSSRRVVRALRLLRAALRQGGEARRGGWSDGEEEEPFGLEQREQEEEEAAADMLATRPLQAAQLVGDLMVGLTLLWKEPQMEALRQRVERQAALLRTLQHECHRAALLLAGGLASAGCVLCSEDSLARCMLAHMLPVLWSRVVKQAEVDQREAAARALLEEEEGAAAAAAAAAAGKKKKKKKKGGGAQAAGAADEGEEETAEEEEGEGDDYASLLELAARQRTAERQPEPAAAHRGAARPLPPHVGMVAQPAAGDAAAERDAGYQRMLAEMAAEEEKAEAARRQRPPAPLPRQPAAEQPPAAAEPVAAVAEPTGSSAVPAPGEPSARSGTAGERPAADEEQQHSLAALQAASAAFDWSQVERDGWEGAAQQQQQQQQPAAEWQPAPQAGHKPRSAAAAAPTAAVADKTSITPAAAVDKAAGKVAAPAAPRPKLDPKQPRVVGWDGTWVCRCGTQHAVTKPCKVCNTGEPCRDFLKGVCNRGCKYTHPQFALEPAAGPPKGMLPRDIWVHHPDALQRQVLDQWRVRVVSWIGDWVCPCERTHFMRINCPDCGYSAPCRDWLRGNCQPPAGKPCRYPHPPFALPAGKPPPADARVVNERPGMPQWTGVPTTPGQQQQRSASAGGTVVVAVRQRTAGAAAAGPAGPSTGSSPQALLDAAPPTIVAALAEQLGVTQAGLTQLLDPEDLAMALEQMQEAEAARVQQQGTTEQQQEQQRQEQSRQRQWQQQQQQQAQGAQHGDGMRIVSSSARWVCGCGQLNRATRGPTCTHSGCSQLGPCRRWMLGTCPAGPACEWPHPPFDPSGDWQPVPGRQKAVLWEGAPRYGATPPPLPHVPGQPQAQAGLGWSPLMSLPMGAAATAAAMQLAAAPPLPLVPAASSAAPAGAAGGEAESDEMLELLQQMGISAGPEEAPSWQPPPADLSSLITPGLRNETGEYNCFLNVIIQCLWRCADFRQQVMEWGPLCQRDAVAAALYSLFQAFAAEEAARQAGGPLTGTAARRGLVDPTPLRHALSALPGQQYRVGEMNDAGEVLLTLYERAMGVSEGAASAVNEIFGLPVSECVRCHKCGRTTHNSSYTQYFYNIQAAALQEAPRALGPAPTMGQLFRRLEAQHMKSCDEDNAGCGTKNSVVYSLGRLPRVFTLQLGWASQREEPAAIAATLRAVDEQVNLGEFYQGEGLGQRRYALRAMVCYYGAHYLAFVWAKDLGAWLVCDDATASRVGTWVDVRRKCEAGRIQPSVLFYEAV
ncbi:Inactive ubiquitin carboxyl-terminal hydrolase 54 isoform A [Micractinium conductrix]|uniref:Inactive ubiquitin carboxyl-terminal hydrolase 54 isoform A n=1 Tax=Micractinium conductrix TaxID=554055 RepID=A0A2P6V0W8_9CHLO|nr:Inactive ubiquitin carboxyl-terminal hydrolase 54 isoform A [Micractinium conductrix]|eukprot:PSC67694.1 Inactive ubiquitin carboxyl-terminal hydrolase 54 isoform A [Micractinium conductrix]